MTRLRGASLRRSLLIGTLIWVCISLGAAGWALRGLFQQHITKQLQQQLVLQLDQLSAALDWSDERGLTLQLQASDPRLQQPLSGLYWQVDQLGQTPEAGALRSRSLWDQLLPLPAARQAQPRRDHRLLHLQGNDGEQLLVVTRTLQLPDDDAPPLRLAVAGDTALLAEPLARFTRMLVLTLAVLAAGLALAIIVQLQLALAPLKKLRLGLAAVHHGRASQLKGRFPRELQPLVADFNHVLRENADMVQRARTQAGNLAHAVNTPLAILANAADGQSGALATLVCEQVQIARRQVDWNLARARASAAVRATGLRTPVRPTVQALLRTMRRLHGGRGLHFELAETAQDLAFAGEPQDLYELLGNLLDNAGKWARSRVCVDVQRAGGQLAVSVADDGPGIAAEQREFMLARGTRLDETHPGAGLGLDIVRALAETYGGSVQVQTSGDLGGARLLLHLPLAGG